MKWAWSALIYGIGLLLLSSCAGLLGGKSGEMERENQGRPHPPGTLRLDKMSLIIDARSDFEYSMNKIPDSVHLRWLDYVEERCPSAKQLMADRQKLADRLALKGIHPERTVVVVGTGPSGGGDEGWLAWVLFQLGVEDVYFLPIKEVERSRRANDKYGIGDTAKNVDSWRPRDSTEMAIGVPALVDLIKKKTRGKLWVLDVRSAKTYQRSNEFALLPVQPMNIEWGHFFDRKGYVNRGIGRDLEALGIQRGDRIVVVSQRGIKSAAVTMALLSLGFVGTTNLDGGADAWRACQLADFSN